MIEWILAHRTVGFTNFFKCFPLLANEYFYTIIIALGYWLKPKSLTFKSLGFLVPFSTIINCLLKNLFQIKRPDIFWHLIKVYDPYGFPSGDVHIAVVFWGYFFIKTTKSTFKFLYLLPIIGIAISRIYLGVHSLYDVLAALSIGILTLYIWHKFIIYKLSSYSFNEINKRYWSLLALVILLYLIISNKVSTPHMIPIAVGALIGFGLSLRWLINFHHLTKMHILNSVFSLGIIVFLSLIIPIIKINKFTINTSLVLKFLVITINIFYFVPRINFKLINNKNSSIL